ncbi:hypothetical protein [Ornithinimicrobium sp. LYQ103]|uniref:hypothetical protein n=1 Tax=Ornithinimicrobium sp. LYQ103 TaxID=3378796 RepID=UPI0038528FEF
MKMPNQVAAQRARGAARQARAQLRAERVAREKRLARAGERVAVELTRRDAAVANHEWRAGTALREMVQTEGLGVREALRWCGVEGLSSREALRMMRLRDGDQDDLKPDGGGDEGTANPDGGG